MEKNQVVGAPSQLDRAAELLKRWLDDKNQYGPSLTLESDTEALLAEIQTTAAPPQG